MSSAATFRDYLVTVTPRSVTYAGSWRGGEYTVTITARTRAEAIAKARRERKDEDGRQGVAMAYRARLAPAEPDL